MRFQARIMGHDHDGCVALLRGLMQQFDHDLAVDGIQR
jgi:hypothetical protein